MTLTLAEFVLMVLIGSGALILMSAIASRTLHARAEKRSLRRRMVCRLCLHAWENRDAAAKVAACPACGATNENRI
jgi:rubrerythrin